MYAETCSVVEINTPPKVKTSYNSAHKNVHHVFIQKDIISMYVVQ